MPPMLLRWLLAGPLAVASLASVAYDGALNTTPDQQGWTYLTNPLIGSQATQTAQGGATTLDTTAAVSDKAGYFSFGGLGVLDRGAGFTLGVDLQLLQESHLTPDRAGLSLIVLSSGLWGIELGFWNNEVWAQNNGFTHGEGASFDTTQTGIRYDLTIHNDSYDLAANGAPLLSGSLRDYSSFGTPYNQPNLVFLGDDTSSASARFGLSRIELSAIPVPEPRMVWLLAVGVLGVAVSRWRSQGAGLSRRGGMPAAAGRDGRA